MTSLFRISFVFHDSICRFLRRYYRSVKTALLLVAHASLFGFFFPELRNDFGEWARNLLVLILFLSPLARLFPIPILQLLMGLRRELGILFGYVATVHGVGYLLDPEWFPPSYFSLLSQVDPRLLFGIFAYILTLPLLFTSNNLSLKLLKGNWKRLHWVVYLVFVLGMLHTFTIRRASGIWEAIFVMGVYLALKVFVRYPNAGTLLSFKKLVAEEYARYRFH